jgi:hypothetical protein
MRPSFVLFSALAGLLVFVPASWAQTQTAKDPASSQPPEVLPPPGAETTPATDSGEKKAPSVSAAGYAYSDKPVASAHHPRFRQKGPVVNMPGFEQQADGGSRLFVQLSQSVPVEERRGQGTITYVLRGASPRVHNNTNELVTVHFNTPVSRARLVPQGQDLLFVVELRAAVSPTFKMEETQDKTATLAIDFPKGDFLQLGAADATPKATARAAAPATKPRVGKRGAAPKPQGAGPRP